MKGPSAWTLVVLLAVLLFASDEFHPSQVFAYRDNAARYLRSGKTKFENKDWDGAIADYTKAIQVDPKSGVAYLNRGLARHAKGAVEGAIEDFTKVIELTPKSAMAFNYRGNSKRLRGDLDGAIADYTKAIQYNPSYAEAYNNRGIARDGKGDLDGAFADYTRAIELDPMRAEAYINRGVVKHDRGDLVGAIADFVRATEIRPGSATALTHLANSRRLKGDLDAAIVDYTRAIEVDPNQARAYLGRGIARHDKGDFEAAIRDLSRAVEIDPRNTEAYYNLANSRHLKGDLEGAITDYTRSIQLNPTYTDAFLGRGLARRDKGDLAGAISDLSRAVSLDPHFAMAYYERALVRYKNGDFEGAVLDFTSTIELTPNNADAFLNRGNAKDELGDVEGSLVDYAQASELDPRIARPSEPNLIANPSLEEGPGPDGLPSGWGRFAVPGDGYRFSITEGGRTGDHALLIQGAGEYGGIVTTRIRLDRSKQYAARGWVKMEGDPKATGTVKLDYYDAEGKYLSSTYSGILTPDVTGWQHVAVADRAADYPTAATIAVVVALTGQGSAWFDDLELITRDLPPGMTSSNLVVNGSIESVKGRTPSNWFLGKNEGAQVALSASVYRPKDGWYSMHLRGNAEWALALSERIKIDRSKTYRLAAYARARTGKAQIKIDYFQDEKNIGQTISEDVVGNEWQMRTIKTEFNRFPQATHIAVAGVGTGMMDVWFDAFMLSVVSE